MCACAFFIILLLKMQIMFSFFCFVSSTKKPHTHINVHVTQNPEFNNWSNLIQCNWLKLRNFINIQWNICFDDIETTKLIGPMLYSYSSVCVCVPIFSALATMHCQWQTINLLSIVMLFIIGSSFRESNEMRIFVVIVVRNLFLI